MRIVTREIELMLEDKIDKIWTVLVKYVRFG
jgi:hypothetical protein